MENVSMSLNTFGVEALSDRELQTIEGGNVWRWVFRAYEAAQASEAVQDFLQGVREGFESVRN